MIDQKLFGEHLRKLRVAHGLTQEKLAERAGLSWDCVRRLERGKWYPSLGTLTKWSLLGLGMPLSELFESLEAAAAAGKEEISA